MSLQAPYHLLSGPKPSTSSSQPRFTTWLHLGISKPSTISSHFRLLYRSCRVASGRTQVGTELGLHYPGYLRACTPRGQPQTTSEHQHHAPTQLILHGGWRLAVSGHSQSLQLTGQGKSSHWPANSNQARLNYKRRVYSAHTEGTP